MREPDEFRDIESADGIRIGICQWCSHPHLFLLDENGDPFAEVVLDAESIAGLINSLQQALRELSLGTIS